LIKTGNQKEWQRRFQISQENEMRKIEEEIERQLEEFAYPDVQKIIVGFEEMCMNAIVHGNNNDFTKKVVISIVLNAKELKIMIQDEGHGFDPNLPQDSLDPDKLLEMLDQNWVEKYTHGRGIFLTRNYMDEVIYNESGNQVTLVKKRTSREIV